MLDCGNHLIGLYGNPFTNYNRFWLWWIVQVYESVIHIRVDFIVSKLTLRALHSFRLAVLP